MISPTTPAAEITNNDQLRPYLNLMNQVFEIEKKLDKLKNPGSIGRNVRKMKEAFAQDLFPNGGLVYEDPIGQSYDETRSDCEASISGESTEDLVVVDTIKPIVRLTVHDMTRIVQRAVVVVESKSSNPSS